MSVVWCLLLVGGYSCVVACKLLLLLRGGEDLSLRNGLSPYLTEIPQGKRTRLAQGVEHQEKGVAEG